MFLICYYFLYWTSECYKEECQAEYNKKHTISFLPFFSFQAAHIGSHWEVFYKKRFRNYAKTNQKIPAKVFNFSLKLHASSLQLY